MIKVITTVGTSLIENYEKLVTSDENIKKISEEDKLKFLKNKDLSGNIKDRINKLKTNIEQKLLKNSYKNDAGEFVDKKDHLNNDASAEIKSIIEIQKEVSQKENQKIQVHLIATDTEASVLCAELIKKFFDEFYDSSKENFSVCFTPNTDKIKGLQIWNKEKFEDEGILNLSNRIYQIQQNRKSLELKREIDKLNKNKQFKDVEIKEKELSVIEIDCILNMTGGFKGIIPYVSTLAQLMKMDIYYIFEDSSSLIKMPEISVQFDWNLAESYYYALADISSGYALDKKTESKLLRENYIKSKKSSIDLTGYGKFFMSFIENEMPQSKDVFGFIIEYKIYENVVNKSYINDEYLFIEHSNEDLNRLKILEKPWVKEKGAEIDIVLKKKNEKINSGNNNYIACEIKSLFQIENDNALFGVIEQTKSRIKLMERDKSICDEYHLYIYTFNEGVYSKRSPKNLEQIKCSVGNIKFKVFFILINLDSMITKNGYQEFIQNEVASIKEIKL